MIVYCTLFNILSLQAAQIATAYLADAEEVAAAKADFLAYFADVEAGGLAAKQAPAPVHEVAAPVAVAAPAVHAVAAPAVHAVSYAAYPYAAHHAYAAYPYAAYPYTASLPYYGYGVGLPYYGLPYVVKAAEEAKEE